MITFRHNATNFGNVYLECAGHAGYAPAGQDIVCAAASMLMEATAEALRRSRAERLEIRAEDGEAFYSIRCRLTPETAAIARVCVSGFDLLAQDVPEYVTAKKIKKPELTKKK